MPPAHSRTPSRCLVVDERRSGDRFVLRLVRARPRRTSGRGSQRVRAVHGDPRTHPCGDDTCVSLSSANGPCPSASGVVARRRLPGTAGDSYLKNKPRTVDHSARGSMKTAANCESQCKMHYLLNRSSTRRTQMAAHYVGHACPRVGYTSARARNVSDVLARRCHGGGQTRHLAGLPFGAIRGYHRRPAVRAAERRRPFREPPSSGRVVDLSLSPSGERARRPAPVSSLRPGDRPRLGTGRRTGLGPGRTALGTPQWRVRQTRAGIGTRRRTSTAEAFTGDLRPAEGAGAASRTRQVAGTLSGRWPQRRRLGVVTPAHSHPPTSDQARLPARFKHISKRRKRN